MRRAWKGPELIALVRGKPEEAVLGACKLVALDAGYHGALDTCAYDTPTCNDCVGIVTS